MEKIRSLEGLNGPDYVRQKSINKYLSNPNKCLYCDSIIEIKDGGKAYQTKIKKFCNHTCAASYNNLGSRKHGQPTGSCVICGEKKLNYKSKCCSINCFKKYNKEQMKLKIELDDGSLRSIHYKKYLIEMKGDKCEKCGWCEIHPTTGKVPIELEHKDGNSYNNKLNNLELLCPNCHSLTTTYRALNIGNGRKDRHKKIK